MTKEMEKIRKDLHEKLKDCRPKLKVEYESFLFWHRNPGESN